MKRILFVPGLLAFLALSTSARASTDVVLRTLTGELPAGTRTIQIDNRMGNVAVRAVPEGFGWEWALRTSDKGTARAENYAQDCRVDVHEANGVLQLRVVRPDAERSETRRNGVFRAFLAAVTLGAVPSHEPNVRSDLVLKVPAASAVAVKNQFGSVRVEGTREAVGVDCQNGDVHLANLDGAVTARTSFARLRAEKVGPAKLTNQNGSIEVSGVTGEFRATTSFAKIKVTDVKGRAVLKNQNGLIEAKRITGDLTAETSFAELHATEIGGNANLKTQNSRIDAVGITGELAATTSFGALRASGVAGGANLKNQNGGIVAERVTGNLSAVTSFAELRVEEVGGSAVLKCDNGKIDVARVTGSVRAKTTFAPLRVRDIGGAVELDGQNCEVVATGVSGDIDARTSFGRLKLDGNGRRILARSQNGSVDIVARSPSVEHIEASATFAPITLQLPNEAKPFIRAVTSFGKVESDFPVLLAATMSEAKFAADAAPLKINLKGQNGDIRIQQIAAR